MSFLCLFYVSCMLFFPLGLHQYLQAKRFLCLATFGEQYARSSTTSVNHLTFKKVWCWAPYKSFLCRNIFQWRYDRLQFLCVIQSRHLWNKTNITFTYTFIVTEYILDWETFCFIFIYHYCQQCYMCIMSLYNTALNFSDIWQYQHNLLIFPTKSLWHFIRRTAANFYLLLQMTASYSPCPRKQCQLSDDPPKVNKPAGPLHLLTASPEHKKISLYVFQDVLSFKENTILLTFNTGN